MVKIVNRNYSKRSEPEGGFKSFEAFYPFYLGEHCNKINRRLHILGTTITHILALLSIKYKNPKFLLFGIAQAYIFAWFGHFIFEKNKPATFRYPIWSFLGDLKMWHEVMIRKREF
ncbi:uncharacterized protein BX663DRAFT_479776 [Cokeromyces recurvatus]|uniref:uncharacterized protein n=1 Tax=Cokeromyces recurvatus TaxID=90255 RepID=UPI00221FAF90|nr:uncharacterized protein BX663DRAFT_479776 [Cokeromyces recurvatus]KAI7898618.1 hypothetical protein BX663DRAFT_479776 [Cokeromyces recurvatus]